MKRRLLCLLLTLVMVVGLMTIAAAAEEELLFRTGWTNSNGEWEWDAEPRSLKDEHGLLPRYGHRLKLYYGTKDNCEELIGGTLTSSDTDVIWVDTKTVNNVTYYQVSAQKFGNTMLTYTNGDTSYTAEVTIGLTDDGSFYSERERTEETWLETIPYDAENGTTVWLMSKDGFSEADTQQMSVYVENNLFGTATAVTRDEVADVPVYDIRIDLPVGLVLTEEWSRLDVQVNGWYYGAGIEYKADPGLMFKRVWFNMNVLEEDDRIWNISEGSDNPMPGESISVNLYYGTEENPTPLAGGAVTSSNPDVATIEQVTQNGATFYRFQGNGFGTTTLTYTDGTNAYSSDMTIQLRTWGDFYSKQDWSTDTWLGQPCYDPENGTTMWFMSRDGFDYAETQNLSFQVDGEAFGTATAVKRDETVEDINARYDIKIELPAGKNISSDNPQARLYYGGSDYGSNLKIIYPPALMFRYMNGNYNSMYEDTSRSPQPLDMLGLAVNYNNRIRLYYGTVDSFNALDLEAGTVTSSDPSILQISKVTTSTQDGLPCYEFEGIGVGTATVTYSCGDVTYTEDISVGLPEYGFYSGQERSPETLLPHSICVADLTDGVLWLLAKNGFTKTELSTTKAVLDGEEVAYDTVERSDGNYDVKIKLDTSSIGIDGVQLQVTRQESWGVRYVANAWLVVLRQGQAAYVGDYIVAFAFPVGNTEDIYEFNEEGWRLGFGTDQEEADVYQHFRDTFVKAAIRKTDEAGGKYYEVKEDVTADIRVSRIWIEPASGNKNGFSFSETSCVQELTGENLSLNNSVYVRQGTTASAMLYMQVQLTVNGETLDQKIGIAMWQQAITIEDWDRPDNDTVEALNAFLLEQSKNLEKNVNYHLNLGPEYTGTIEIPAAFNDRDYELYVHGRPNGTKLHGALHLNNATIGNIRDVHFISTDEAKIGVYGGSVLNMVNCTFQNYELAIDASLGMVTLTEGNVLIGNDIAYRLDLTKATANGSNMNPWQCNTFINNGTAVQILSFTQFISPYHLRIYETNFFGNGVDFDVQTNATLYFYRNYFADWNTSRKNINLNALSNANTHSAVFRCLTPREPLMGNTTETVKINTNPRWFYPVRNWWRCSAKITDIFGDDYDCIAESRSPVLMSLMAEETTDSSDETTVTEEPYVNYLTADWTRETNILNSMAGSLELDASAFETSGEKSIAILDDQEQTIGTWTFEDVQTLSLMSELAETFNAHLIKGWDGEELLVTVADNAVLVRQAAFLTIPCGDVDWTGVKVIGPGGKAVSVEWDAENKTVTFPVVAGGTYRIGEAALMLASHNTETCDIKVVVEPQHEDKVVILASYDENGRFLGLTSGSANTDLAYEKDAAVLGVFLVDALETMLPQTEASMYQIN